jgi:hypothetical protein
MATVIPALRPGPAWTRQVPRAPLPIAGVTSYSVASRTSSEGITPPSSLIRAHAPDQIPLGGFGPPSSDESSQVVVSPCCEMALPGVISANLSPHAWTRTPVPPLVLLPVSSQETSAFADSRPARLGTISIQRLPYGLNYAAAVIRSSSGLRVCSPPRSLLPQCCHWAAVTFTSEQNLCCYLHRHRIC